MGNSFLKSIYDDDENKRETNHGNVVVKVSDAEEIQPPVTVGDLDRVSSTRIKNDRILSMNNRRRDSGLLSTIKQADERVAINWKKATHKVSQVRLERRRSTER